MKVISIIILSLILAVFYVPSIAQPPLERKNGNFYLENEKISKKDFKKLILNINDSTATHHFRWYRVYNISGNAVGALGMLLIASPIVYNFFCPWLLDPYLGGSGCEVSIIPFLVGGGIMFAGGIVLIHVGSRQAWKSIDRFNILQQSNLKVDINRNGIGLRYNF